MQSNAAMRDRFFKRPQTGKCHKGSHRMWIGSPQGLESKTIRSPPPHYGLNQPKSGTPRCVRISFCSWTATMCTDANLKHHSTVLSRCAPAPVRPLVPRMPERRRRRWRQLVSVRHHREPVLRQYTGIFGHNSTWPPRDPLAPPIWLRLHTAGFSRNSSGSWGTPGNVTGAE